MDESEVPDELLESPWCRKSVIGVNFRTYSPATRQPHS